MIDKSVVCGKWLRKSRSVKKMMTKEWNERVDKEELELELDICTSQLRSCLNSRLIKVVENHFRRPDIGSNIFISGNRLPISRDNTGVESRILFWKIFCWRGYHKKLYFFIAKLPSSSNSCYLFLKLVCFHISSLAELRKYSVSQ